MFKYYEPQVLGRLFATDPSILSKIKWANFYILETNLGKTWE